MNNIHLIVRILAFFCGVVGVSASIQIGTEMRSQAEAIWLKDARAEASRSSEYAHSAVAQTLSGLRSFSALFHGSEHVTADEFSAASEAAQEWEQEIPLSTLAYARRATRSERHQLEADLGTPLRAIGSEQDIAPQSYESFAVTLLVSEAQKLRLGDDLMTMPEMASVVATAYRVPHEVVLGPAFRGSEGELYALAGQAAPNGAYQGVLVALLNLGDFFEPFRARQVEEGLLLRLVERNNEARAHSFYTPVIGSDAPLPDVVETFPIRMAFGQARWELNWDVMPWYGGGPNYEGAQAVEWGGSIASLIIALVILLLAGQNRRVQRLVQERTSDLQRRQEELVIAKGLADSANQAKSYFLAAVSHELRTPLNAIIGFSELIKAETFGPVGNAKYVDYVGDIYWSGQHLLKLINDLLDICKIEAGKYELHEETIDVANITESAVNLVLHRAEERDVDLLVDVQPTLPGLYADHRKLTQILVNLLSNAVKFTEVGGKVTLKAWCREDSGFIFQVIDTGIGIPPENIPTALSQFSQVHDDLELRHEGTGLGLPLAKALTELHGGSLDLQSEVNVGTTVTVRLPATRIVQTTSPMGLEDRIAS